jgi:zinc/manganese transport system permease protein
MAALVFGYDARLGLFAFTIVAAIGLGLLGRRGQPDDITIGGVFAWTLGIGALFLTLYATSSSSSGATAGVSTLFGSIFGLSQRAAVTAALVGLGVTAAVLFAARPLIFASLDEAVASARGLPVSLLGLVFLVLVGITTAEATQAVGALLVLGLLAAPAGAALQLTQQPFRAMWLSAVFAVSAVWAGLILAYAVPVLPPSFAILAVASLFYALAAIFGRLHRSRITSYQY